MGTCTPRRHWCTAASLSHLFGTHPLFGERKTKTPPGPCACWRVLATPAPQIQLPIFPVQAPGLWGLAERLPGSPQLSSGRALIGPTFLRRFPRTGRCLLLLIPPPLIPPLTSLKGRKGLGTFGAFAKSRLARTAGRAVRLCRPPRGRTSASLRGLTCHSCHRHGWPEKNLYTELVVLRP